MILDFKTLGGNRFESLQLTKLHAQGIKYIIVK